MSESRRFHKIKRTFTTKRSKNGNTRRICRVELSWEESEGGNWVTRSLSDPAPAVDEFYDAFDALREDFLDPVGLGHDRTLTVYGVSYTYNKDGGAFVVLSGGLVLEGYNAPLVLNMPRHAPSGALTGRLTDLEHQAGLYIDGTRGQLEMAFTEPDDGDEEDEDEATLLDLDEVEVEADPTLDDDTEQEI